ncbi:DUF445 family protein [Clostridium sp. BJN0001]|uniref:DUF445 family protein n=1 Tax=Clostridium sp. BJN0001 TaxID=2930219 RepID=UPI001FD05A57|nr:DUF445 family protein [Clostridium sp. BJN0001]
MDIKILLFILQVLSGGTAGYITNKYAVNMLFKEYKPLNFLGFKSIKFGGIVKKNKEKFIEEISNLVERDIINASTIKDSIKSTQFKDEILKTTDTFISESLIKNSENFSLKNFDGFSKTKENILKVISNVSDVVLDETIHKNIDVFKVDEIITDSQSAKITDFIYNVILNKMGDDGIIKECFDKSYSDVSSYKLSEISGQELKQKIKKNICTQIEKYDEKKISYILKDAGFYNVFNDFLKSIGERNIGDILDEDSSYKISKYAASHLKEYIHSDNAKYEIEKALNKIISILENTDSTIYEVVGDDFASKINIFLKNNIEKAIPYISEWIRKNKAEIENLIEESVDESVGTMNESIKKIIITKVRESFLSDISSKSGIVEKIIKYIEDLSSSDEASYKIYETLFKFIKENKIKDIVKKLKENKIISDDNIKKVSSFIIDKIDKNSDKIVSILIERIKIQKISNLINVSNNEENLEKYLSKASYFIKNQIEKNSSHILDTIFDKNASDFISSSEIFLKVKSYIENSKEKIYDYIKNEVKNFNLADNEEDIKKFLNTALLTYSEKKIEEYSSKNLSLVLSKEIKNKKEISKYIGNEVLNYAYSEIDSILKDKVKKIVKDNLLTYDDDKILELADRFMGKELRPISVFGAFLGSLAGFIFAIFSTNIGIYGFYMSPFSIISSVILMSLVGIFTNVIALWMLFHPYKQNKFLKKIPFLKYFSLGYIPAHKKALASGVASVIESDLLNSDKIKVLLKKNEETIISNYLHDIKKNDYKKVLSLIKKKKSSIISFAFKKTNSLNINNAQKNAERIKDLDVQFFIKNLKIDENEIKKILILRVKKYLNDGFKDILTEEKVLSYSKELNVKNIVLNNNDTYSDFLKNSLNDILNDEKCIDLKKSIVKKIDSSLLDNFSEVMKKEFEKFLFSEFCNDKTIGDIFNGNVKSLIDKNLNSITMFLAEKINLYISSNKDSIKDTVINNVSENLGFFERIAYSTFGGDKIVSRTVDIMIDKKLVPFIGLKFNEIKDVVNNILYKNVYPINVKELKVKSEEFNLNNIFEKIDVEFKSDKDFRNNINKKIGNVLDKIFSKELGFYADLLNINNSKLFIDKFNNECDILDKSILLNVENNIKKLTEDVNDNIKFISASAFNNIDIDKFEYTADKLSDIIKPECKNLSSIVLDIKSKKIGDIIDEKDFVFKVKKVISNISVERFLYEKVFDMIIDEKLSFISDDIKESLSKVILYSASDAVKMHIKNIIINARLKDISVKEIMLMQSKTIDDLFKSFAGAYYKRLYIYGAFGGIFGLNIYSSVIVFLAESLNTFFEEKGGEVFEK